MARWWRAMISRTVYGVIGKAASKTTHTHTHTHKALPVGTYSQLRRRRRCQDSSRPICKDHVCKWRRWRPQILVDVKSWSMAVVSCAGRPPIIQRTGRMMRAARWWSSCALRPPLVLARPIEAILHQYWLERRQLTCHFPTWWSSSS